MAACLAADNLRIFRDPLARFLWRNVFPLQFSLGVLGNSLNLFVLTSNDIPNNIANDLLAAVSLCDLAFLLALLPHSLAAFDSLGTFSSSFRLFYLQTRLHFAGFANWMSAAAIWLILAVSAERLLVVRHPLRSKMYWGGSRRACILASLFIATGAITLYHHFEYDCEIVQFCNGSQLFEFCYPASETHPVRYGSEVTHKPHPSIRVYMKASAFFNALLVVFMPIVLVAVLSGCLLRSLRVRARLLAQPPNARCRRRTHSRVTLTVVAIALAFSLTQGPSAVMTLCELFSGFTLTNYFYTLFSLTNSLVVTGKTINFILFCLSSSYFRSKCVGIIVRKLPKTSWLSHRLSEYSRYSVPGDQRAGSVRTIRSTRRDSAALVLQPLSTLLPPSSTIRITRRIPPAAIAEDDLLPVEGEEQQQHRLEHVEEEEEGDMEQKKAENGGEGKETDKSDEFPSPPLTPPLGNSSRHDS